MYSKSFFVAIFVLLELRSSLAGTSCYSATDQFCTSKIQSAHKVGDCNAQWGAFPRLNSNTNALITLHLDHSMKYLLQATRFNEWDVSRPGFNTFFNKLSDDEWDSAISLMIYAMKRGGELTKEFKVETPNADDFNHQQNEFESLSKALDLEKKTATQTLKLIHDATHVHKEPTEESKATKSNEDTVVIHTSANATEHTIPVGYRDAAFADFLAERLNDISVLRIKHLANYVNMLSQVLQKPEQNSKLTSVDNAYALYTFDSQILK